MKCVVLWVAESWTCDYARLSHCVPLVLHWLSLNYSLRRPPVFLTLTLITRAAAAMVTAGISSPERCSAAFSKPTNTLKHTQRFDTEYQIVQHPQ